MVIKMGVFANAQPRKVFEYFEQICSIPHGSGNTKQLSDHIKKFASERDLRCVQDEHDNIVIWADASKGYENAETVILQGHLDMVCEKDECADIDFDSDGLRLCVEGDTISAEGTTLGGDDGIAVAYCLALLDSDDISHPPLEVVFTSDEEIGMLGAAALDMSLLKGRRLLNLDSEEEGHILVSCAGGVTAEAVIPVTRLLHGGERFRIDVSGLIGGHSGAEIDKGRANANVLLGRVLYRAAREADIFIESVDGGLKDNAIPRSASAVVCADGKAADALRKAVEVAADKIAYEYRTSDPGITVQLHKVENKAEYEPMDAASTRRVITALMALPCGIERMSCDIEGLVETSLNLGILKTKENETVFSYSVRSSVASEKEALTDRLVCIAEALGGYVEFSGDYPAWEYRNSSPLRDICVSVFEKQYGRKPVVYAIHAGVECGLFDSALEGLDAVSVGPEIKDIHTPEESMSIASVKRTWDFLCGVLAALKDV